MQINEELLFSLNIPAHLGDIGFDLHECYTSLQLCQVAYLTVEKQREKLKKYGFKCFKSFVKENTCAFICKKQGTLFIVFRGTDFSDPRDISDNLNIRKVNDGKGKVHAGYKEHLDRVWRDILKAISANKFRNIIVTGHSMGGGVGQIINHRLPGTKGYYFGSTRSVNSRIFKNQKSFIYHIQNSYDLVPNTPPRIFGYRLLGEAFILEYGKLYSRPKRLGEIFYTLFYMFAFIGMFTFTKMFGVNERIKDIILTHHKIADYHKNFEAYVVEETFNMLRYEKKLKKI
jgi:hypothetical protein